jgi:hypothetical protein
MYPRLIMGLLFHMYDIDHKYLGNGWKVEDLPPTRGYKAVMSLESGKQVIKTCDCTTDIKN